MELLRIGRRKPDLADPDAAIDAARKAVSLTKEQDAAMLKILALALGENDQPQEAIATCEKALELMAGQENPDPTLKADLEAARSRYQRASGNQ